ncbi:MAG TPA: hypothetical protein VMC09_06840 [Anaerolineales bacterium]|nr:hypothetical protein [Anaerolineales bacterium]
MYEPTFTPPPPPPPPFAEPKKRPVMGIVSLISAILSLILLCIMPLSVVAVGSGSNFNPTMMTREALAGLGLGIIALLCGSGLFSVGGVGFGIAAIFQKDTSKVMGIIGLVIGILVLLVTCGFSGLLVLNM